MTLLELAVKIFADDQASDKIDGISNGITGKLANAGRAVAEVMGAVTAAAGAAALAVGKMAFDSYAEFEQLKGGVEKIFDQANTKQIFEDAQNAYKDLNMSANDYLESINKVGATFAQTMGDQKGYDTARTGMKAIADYASGTGANLENLNEKYQLITRSSGAYQSIADQFAGILPQTSADFLEQAKQAGFLSDQYTELTQVPVAEYQEAVTKMLEKGVADMGLAGNTLAESTNTISGSLAMVQAAWTNLVTEIAKPDGDIGARISEMMTALFGDESGGGLISNVTQVVFRIADGMAAAMPEVLPRLIELGGTLIGSIAEGLTTNIPIILESLIAGFNTLFEQVSAFVSEVDFGKLFAEGVFSASAILNAIIDMLPSALDGLMNFLNGVVEWIGDNAGTLISAVGNVLSNAASTIVEALPSFLTNVGTLIGRIQAAIAENAPVIMDAVIRILTSLVRSLIQHGPEILQAAGQMVLNIGKAIVDKAPEIMSNFGHMLGTLIGSVAGFIGDMIRAGAEFIGGFFKGNDDGSSGVKDFFRDLPQNLLNLLGDIGAFLLDAGMSFLGGLFDGINDAAPEVVDFFVNLPENLLNALGDVGSFLINAGMDLLNGLWEGVQDIGSSVVDWFTELPGNILDALGDLGDLLWNAGQDIINGFWDGLMDTFESVKDWVEGIGEWIADNKGPKQYDLGLLVPNGRWIIEGLDKGLRKQFPAIANTIGELTDMMQADAKVGMDVEGLDGRAAARYPRIVIEHMEVREEADIYKTADQLDLIWSMESAGSLV